MGKCWSCLWRRAIAQRSKRRVWTHNNPKWSKKGWFLPYQSKSQWSILSHIYGENCVQEGHFKTGITVAKFMLPLLQDEWNKGNLRHTCHLKAARHHDAVRSGDDSYLGHVSGSSTQPYLESWLLQFSSPLRQYKSYLESCSACHFFFCSWQKIFPLLWTNFSLLHFYWIIFDPFYYKVPFLLFTWWDFCSSGFFFTIISLLIGLLAV